MEFFIKGIKIRLDFLFSASVTLLLCFNTGFEIKYGILFSLVHELGHLLAIFICGEQPEMIRFGAFGMTILRQNDITQNYKKELITAIGGPLMNLLLFLIFSFFYNLLSDEKLLRLALINLIIGAFNIMPVISLDGGRALESILKQRFAQDRSEKILRAASGIFIAIMLVLGIYILIRSKYNFTFLFISIYLFVLLVK